jgi:hypothetical protein
VTREAAVRRRRLALAAVLLLVLVAVAALWLWPDGPDPFVGVFWEQETGRRIEITKRDDVYRLTYGVNRQSYEGERHGDELYVKEPFGQSVIWARDDGTLLLHTSDGQSVLAPLKPSD